MFRPRVGRAWGERDAHARPEAGSSRRREESLPVGTIRIPWEARTRMRRWLSAVPVRRSGPRPSRCGGRPPDRQAARDASSRPSIAQRRVRWRYVRVILANGVRTSKMVRGPDDGRVSRRLVPDAHDFGHWDAAVIPGDLAWSAVEPVGSHLHADRLDSDHCHGLAPSGGRIGLGAQSAGHWTTERLFDMTGD